MSDGTIALLILFGGIVVIVAGLIVESVKDPEAFAQRMTKAADAAKAHWAAKQEEKKKKQDETTTAIADFLTNILKKKS